MTNAPYKTDGISTRIYKDGTRVDVTWRGLQIESREKIYTLRQYSDGETVYAVNCTLVPELPATPLTRQLLAAWAELQA